MSSEGGKLVHNYQNVDNGIFSQPLKEQYVLTTQHRYFIIKIWCIYLDNLGGILFRIRQREREIKYFYMKYINKLCIKDEILKFISKYMFKGNKNSRFTFMFNFLINVEHVTMIECGMFPISQICQKCSRPDTHAKSISRPTP